MVQFHETVMGRKFFSNDFPRLLRELSLLRKTVEEQNQIWQNPQAPLPCALCKVCVHHNNGQFYPGCRDCVANTWGNFRHVDDTES